MSLTNFFEERYMKTLMYASRVVAILIGACFFCVAFGPIVGMGIGLIAWGLSK